MIVTSLTADAPIKWNYETDRGVWRLEPIESCHVRTIHSDHTGSAKNHSGAQLDRDGLLDLVEDFYDGVWRPARPQPEQWLRLRTVFPGRADQQTLEIRLAGCQLRQDKLLELAEALYEQFGMLIELVGSRPLTSTADESKSKPLESRFCRRNHRG